MRPGFARSNVRSANPLSTDPAVRQAYSADVSGLVMLPDAVARPASATQVAEILKQATAGRTPVTPRRQPDQHDRRVHH